MSGPGSGLAVVTGGASGIGAGVAVELARVGHAIGIVDVDEPGARRVAARIEQDGGTALALPTDLRDAAAVEAALAEAVARMGPVTALVSCAGTVEREQPLEEQDATLVRRLVDVNLVGAVHAVQSAVRRMEGPGCIVFISSTSGLQAHPGNALYAATKIALLGLTRSLAAELAPRGVRVNAVCPGGTDTELVRRVYTPEELAETEAANPLGRLGTPHDVASAVRYLVSEATFVNGTTLVVDGGAAVVGVS